MPVHSNVERSQGTPDSALEICNREVKIGVRGGGGKGLGVEPVKGANCRRAIRMASTLPGHKDPTVHLCVASQDTQARR